MELSAATENHQNAIAARLSQIPAEYANTGIWFCDALQIRCDGIGDELEPVSVGLFSWMDIGIFRVLVEYGLDYIDDFQLAVPADFSRSEVAYCKPEPTKPDFNQSYETYFQRNLVWVAGGTFLAEIGVMKNWVSQYQRYVNMLIDLGWSSTDQQVLYAMYSHKFETNRPTINIQVYQIPGNVFPYNWFYLMYVMRHQYLRIKSLASRAPPYDLEVPYKYKCSYYIQMIWYTFSYS